MVKRGGGANKAPRGTPAKRRRVNLEGLINEEVEDSFRKTETVRARLIEEQTAKQQEDVDVLQKKIKLLHRKRLVSRLRQELGAEKAATIVNQVEVQWAAEDEAERNLIPIEDADEECQSDSHDDRGEPSEGSEVRMASDELFDGLDEIMTPSREQSIVSSGSEEVEQEAVDQEPDDLMASIQERSYEKKKHFDKEWTRSLAQIKSLLSENDNPIAKLRLFNIYEPLGTRAAARCAENDDSLSNFLEAEDVGPKSEKAEEFRLELQSKAAPSLEAFCVKRAKGVPSIKRMLKELSVTPTPQLITAMATVMGRSPSEAHRMMGIGINELWRSDTERLVDFAAVAGRYLDVVVADVSVRNADAFRLLSLTHVFSHCYSALFNVWENNLEIKKRAMMVGTESMDPSGAQEFRDQGFDKCRGLIIASSRRHVGQYVKWISAMNPESFSPLGESKNALGFRTGPVTTKELDSFGGGQRGELNALIAMRESGADLRTRGNDADYVDFFRGNADSNLALGVEIRKDRIICHFEAEGIRNDSHLIIATPRGLAVDVLAEHRTPGTYIDPPKYKFSNPLSSLEICVLDRYDALALTDRRDLDVVLAAMNDPLKGSMGSVDYRRVREEFQSPKLSQIVRQTIVLSSGVPEELYSIMAGLRNCRGGYRLELPRPTPIVDEVISKRKLIVRDIPPTCIDSLGATQDFFLKEVLGDRRADGSSVSGWVLPLTELDQKVLLVVRDSVEIYVLIHALLGADGMKGTLKFGCLHEELQLPREARALMKKGFGGGQVETLNKIMTSWIDRWRSGAVKCLVITERLLHYRRPNIADVDHVVFWGHPVRHETAARAIEMVNNSPKNLVVCFQNPQTTAANGSRWLV